MRCKYSISEYRINQLHNGLYYPACPFSKRLRCNRVYTEDPFCPYKEYDLKKIPLIVHIESVACKYKRRGRRNPVSIPCAFDVGKFCGMKGNGPCPYIRLEQSLNTIHDEAVQELWKEVDDWIATTINRARKEVKRKEWRYLPSRKERVRSGK